MPTQSSPQPQVDPTQQPFSASYLGQLLGHPLDTLASSQWIRNADAQSLAQNQALGKGSTGTQANPDSSWGTLQFLANLLSPHLYSPKMGLLPQMPIAQPGDILGAINQGQANLARVAGQVAGTPGAAAINMATDPVTLATLPIGGGGNLVAKGAGELGSELMARRFTNMMAGPATDEAIAAAGKGTSLVERALIRAGSSPKLVAGAAAAGTANRNIGSGLLDILSQTAPNSVQLPPKGAQAAPPFIPTAQPVKTPQVVVPAVANTATAPTGPQFPQAPDMQPIMQMLANLAGKSVDTQQGNYSQLMGQALPQTHAANFGNRLSDTLYNIMDVTRGQDPRAQQLAQNQFYQSMTPQQALQAELAKTQLPGAIQPLQAGIEATSAGIGAQRAGPEIQAQQLANLLSGGTINPQIQKAQAMGEYAQPMEQAQVTSTQLQPIQNLMQALFLMKAIGGGDSQDATNIQRMLNTITGGNGAPQQAPQTQGLPPPPTPRQ